MLDKLIQLSIRQRWIILLAVLAVAALGVYNYQRLPIDAVPDITNVQVQINTEAPGFSRSKPNSASLSQSRPRSAGCPRWNTPAPFRVMASPR